MPGELRAAFVVGSAVWPVQCIRTHLLLALLATSRHLLCKKNKWERNGLLLLFNKRSELRSFSFSTLMLETPFCGDRFRDPHNEACVCLEFDLYFFRKKRARGARTVVISKLQKCCRAACHSTGWENGPNYTEREPLFYLGLKTSVLHTPQWF